MIGYPDGGWTKMLIRLRKRLSFDRRWVLRMEKLAAVNAGLILARGCGVLSPCGLRQLDRLDRHVAWMANLRQSQASKGTRR